MKRARKADADDGSPGLAGINLTMGDGRIQHVPTYKAMDHEKGREFAVYLPDLEGFPNCDRCGGAWTRRRAIMGGLLIHTERQNETWYTSTRACPDCVFGAVRHHAGRQNFQTQFPGCSMHDLARMTSGLRGAKTLREAVESTRGYHAVFSRLTAGLRAMEARGMAFDSPSTAQMEPEAIEQELSF